MKSVAPFILVLFTFSFISCVQTHHQSAGSLSFSTDQTVMLHWLEMDPDGIVREAETEGNATISTDPFTGKAIETFRAKAQLNQYQLGKMEGDMAQPLNIFTTAENAHQLSTEMGLETVLLSYSGLQVNYGKRKTTKMTN